MRKSDIWNATRAKLKQRFFAAGITDCELRIVGGCKLRSFLSFAHRMRRRKMPSYKKDLEAHKAELEVVVLACQVCHEYLDRLDPEETYQIVTAIRERRPV